MFSHVLLRLLPLYTLIGVGFIARRKLAIDTQQIGTLLIYLVTPVVVFESVVATPLTGATILLPLFTFIGSCALAVFTHWILRATQLAPGERGILSYASGCGNSGYFGLPLAMLLFGEEIRGVMVLATLGIILYENSLGFYFAAAGAAQTSPSLSRKHIIRKVITLPSLHAFVLGSLVQLLGFSLGNDLSSLAAAFRGCYTVLGMMLIGMGLASITKVSFDKGYLAAALLQRFVVWPAVTLTAIAIDRTYIQLFPPAVHQVLFLIGIVPMASNTVALAAYFKSAPEKAALAVFVSTALALGVIPLAVGLAGIR